VITIPGSLFWLVKLYAWTFIGFVTGYLVKKLIRFACGEYMAIQRVNQLRADIAGLYGRPEQ